MAKAGRSMSPVRRGRPARSLVQAQELARLGESRLAALLAEQISRLPYHRQREWVARHLPPKGAAKPNPSRLLDDIEAFYAESRAGTFVSWADDDGWDGGAEGEEPEELKEWIEIFTDLMKGAQALSQAGRHVEAQRAYARHRHSRRQPR